MHNQRMIPRPILQRKNLCDCVGIQRIRAKAVDGFGWKRDDLAGLEQRDGGLDGIFRGIVHKSCATEYSPARCGIPVIAVAIVLRNIKHTRVMLFTSGAWL